MRFNTWGWVGGGGVDKMTEAYGCQCQVANRIAIICFPFDVYVKDFKRLAIDQD